jgi:IS5 family transposase
MKTRVFVQLLPRCIGRRLAFLMLGRDPHRRSTPARELRFALQQAQYWAGVKVTFQAVETAVVLNLVSEVAWRLRVRRGQARVARFIKVAMQR